MSADGYWTPEEHGEAARTLAALLVDVGPDGSFSDDGEVLLAAADLELLARMAVRALGQFVVTARLSEGATPGDIAGDLAALQSRVVFTFLEE